MMRVSRYEIAGREDEKPDDFFSIDFWIFGVIECLGATALFAR
jgi:hypothetical protein